MVIKDNWEEKHRFFARIKKGGDRKQMFRVIFRSSKTETTLTLKDQSVRTTTATAPLVSYPQPPQHSEMEDHSGQSRHHACGFSAARRPW
uniref:Uncharacterized protein n=1 Tax=Triticum urartu TaxID=4572 RepID=A0A8R7PPL4_TRIUA